MIVLDTNVVSEAIKPSRDPVVIDWLDKQSAETLFLSATSLAELSMGITVMPDGKRKAAISAALDSLIIRLFDTRILPFDHNAAIAYSRLVSAARAKGKAISMPDGQIGAIASAHNFSVATRDIVPFQALGLQVIDPWKT